MENNKFKIIQSELSYEEYFPKCEECYDMEPYYNYILDILNDAANASYGTTGVDYTSSRVFCILDKEVISFELEDFWDIYVNNGNLDRLDISNVFIDSCLGTHAIGMTLYDHDGSYRTHMTFVDKSAAEYIFKKLTIDEINENELYEPFCHNESYDMIKDIILKSCEDFNEFSLSEIRQFTEHVGII